MIWLDSELFHRHSLIARLALWCACRDWNKTAARLYLAAARNERNKP